MKSHRAAMMIVCTLIALSGWAYPGVSNSDLTVLPTGTALVVELTKAIDAKKVRAGDQVKARLIQDVVLHGQLVIRRGSKVVGHVVVAKAYSKEERQSVLDVAFDKVVLKNGGEIIFSAVIQALAPPREDNIDESSAYAGSSEAGSQPAGRHRTVGFNDPGNLRNQTRADALENAADPVSYGTASNGPRNGWLSVGSRGVIGMPVLSLTSAVIFSTRSNVKLESGVQMVLGITASHPQ